MAPRTKAEVKHCREGECLRSEEMLTDAAGAAIRQFLRKLKRELHLASLTAASISEGDIGPTAFNALLEPGRILGWWQEAVNEELIPQLTQVWREGYTNETAISSGLDALPEFIASVKDRLSPNAAPGLPDDAFNKVRVVLNDSLAAGLSTDSTAQLIAEALSWDDPAQEARQTKAQITDEINKLLDPIGPPGAPAREFARKNDPRIRALRNIRNRATEQIEGVESTWRNRAQRIGRTESTAALNAGATAAFKAEGINRKEWVSTLDPRTRDSHLAANGQVQGMFEPFVVGGALLQFPGDPSGPAEEVINCRCAMVAAAFQ